MKIAVLSGGFDPIHSGHVASFREASEIADRVIVGLNSDRWLTRKKGKPFMPFLERSVIVESMRYVDEARGFYDADNTACDLLESVKYLYPDADIIFCNGGDRTDENIPEMAIEGVEFVFGIGGSHKANSSSWILENAIAPLITERVWGSYKVLHDTPNVKVKELIVEPGRTLSMQRHFKRGEHWMVAEGNCIVQPGNKVLEKYDYLHINIEDWHQLTNPYNATCRIIEIQYGDECIEEDIERK